MSSSALNQGVLQAKVGNIQNQADSTSIYSSGVWSFKNSSAVASVTITDAGNVGIGTNSPTGIVGYTAITTNGTTGSFSEYRQNGVNYLRIGSDGGSGFLNGAGGVLRFLTSDAERMRIDASGNLLVGTTTSPIAGRGRMRVAAIDSSLVLHVERTNTTAGGGLWGADANNCIVVSATDTATKFYVTQTGNYFFAGTSVSDERLKEDIQEVSDQLKNVLALAPKTFRFKAQTQEDGSVGEPGRVQHGFIAQEVKAVLPKLVTGAETNPDEYMGVDYMGLTSVLVKAIQELSAKVDAQAAEIEALKAK